MDQALQKSDEALALAQGMSHFHSLALALTWAIYLHQARGELQAVQERVAAWQERRNRGQASISWRFTTADARIKLKRLYPSIEV